MEVFSKVLEPAQLRLRLANIQDSESRLVSHWWLEMGRGGSIYTRRITRYHKSMLFVLFGELVSQITIRCTFYSV